MNSVASQMSSIRSSSGGSKMSPYDDSSSLYSHEYVLKHIATVTNDEEQSSRPRTYCDEPTRIIRSPSQLGPIDLDTGDEYKQEETITDREQEAPSNREQEYFGPVDLDAMDTSEESKQSMPNENDRSLVSTVGSSFLCYGPAFISSYFNNPWESDRPFDEESLRRGSISSAIEKERVEIQPLRPDTPVFHETSIRQKSIHPIQKEDASVEVAPLCKFTDKPFDEESITQHEYLPPHLLKDGHAKDRKEKEEVNVPIEKESTDPPKKPPPPTEGGLTEFLLQKIEIPVALAYPLFCLVFSLIAMGFIIGYMVVADFSSQPNQTTISDAELFSSSFTFRPTSAPTMEMTPSPTLAPSPTPTQSPVTSPPTRCIDRLSIDRACYVKETDEIMIDFTSCDPQQNDWIGIYYDNAEYLGHNFRDWRWTCGSLIPCDEPPTSLVFGFETQDLKKADTYRVFYIRYDPTSLIFESVMESAPFQIAATCD